MAKGKLSGAISWGAALALVLGVGKYILDRNYNSLDTILSAQGYMTGAECAKNDDYTFLMSNEEFTNVNSASEKQIQDYLERIESALAQPVDGHLFSAEIIRVANEYNINPLLILARAQTEKGAVKKKNLTEKELRELMGYDIPDNGKRNEKTLGFIAQIENAARIMKKHFYAYKEGIEVKINYGDETIVPDNAATFSLFKYTPHTHDNRLQLSKGEVGGGNFLYMNIFSRFRKEILEVGDADKENQIKKDNEINLTDIEIKWKPSPNYRTGRASQIEGIVIHSTEGDGKSALDWLTKRESKVSAHYLIMENGEVYQLVDDKNTAWHAGRKANAGYIGIELAGFADKPGFKFSDEQYSTMAQLALMLAEKYGIKAENIVGHDWVTKNIGGTTHTDPGVNFEWSKFRSKYDEIKVYRAVKEQINVLKRKDER